MNNKEFLDYYRDNLSFFRKLSAEFASEFPKIASRLDLNALECQDPFVERLLEGTAFLTARIEKKLDEGYPRFINSILQSVCPQVLSPIPAYTNLKADLSSQVRADGRSVLLPLNTAFTRNVNHNRSTVTLQNLIETSLHPLSITEARLASRDFEITALTEQGYGSALYMELSCQGSASFDSISQDFLDIYINLSEDDASKLSELLLCNTDSIYLKRDDGRFVRLHDVFMEPTMMSHRENALQKANPGPYGIELLSLYMSCPDCFKYIRVRGLFKAITRALTGRKSGNCTLCFVFNREFDSALENKMHSEPLMLNVFPAVNLFARRSNRIRLDKKYEEALSADLTNPLDYEIYSVDHLEFFDSSNKAIFNAYPFFSGNFLADADSHSSNFFSINRRLRQSGLNAGKRTPYIKSEAFVSVSGEDFKSYMDAPLQFSAQCYCTNADLCLFLNPNDTFVCSDSEKISDASIVSRISKPRPPLVTGESDDDLKKLSFVLMNLSSMLTDTPEKALYTLKQIVRAFSPVSLNETSRLASAIMDLACTPEVFRSITKGCVYFENGYNLRLTLSEKRLEGTGLFTFGSVIAHMLLDYCPLNMPMNIEINSDTRGHVLTCKTLKE